ncbi:MAG: hypothetical protein HXX11_10130 [Desulfuromonadales bacterium]|nr:hypothetical protein [Desulfuromonadales bacterium]
MTPILPSIRRMTFQEASEAGLHSGGLILEHRGNSYHLNAGLSDSVHVFTSSIAIYVLTTNRGHGYIGLDAYLPNEPDPINTVFLHSDYQFTETLGSKWKYMSPRTIATKLINYLI